MWQWFSIATQCGTTVTYDTCTNAMNALVKGCSKGGKSRAGWAYSYDSCVSWTIDNGPDLHRPGVAPNPSG